VRKYYKRAYSTLIFFSGEILVATGCAGCVLHPEENHLLNRLYRLTITPPDYSGTGVLAYFDLLSPLKYADLLRR
jgi:hypothetical protein